MNTETPHDEPVIRLNVTTLDGVLLDRIELTPDDLRHPQGIGERIRDGLPLELKKFPRTKTAHAADINASCAPGARQAGDPAPVSASAPQASCTGAQAGSPPFSIEHATDENGADRFFITDERGDWIGDPFPTRELAADAIKAGIKP